MKRKFISTIIASTIAALAVTAPMCCAADKEITFDDHGYFSTECIDDYTCTYDNVWIYITQPGESWLEFELSSDENTDKFMEIAGKIGEGFDVVKHVSHGNRSIIVGTLDRDYDGIYTKFSELARELREFDEVSAIDCVINNRFTTQGQTNLDVIEYTGEYYVDDEDAPRGRRECRYDLDELCGRMSEYLAENGFDYSVELTAPADDYFVRSYDEVLRLIPNSDVSVSDKYELFCGIRDEFNMDKMTVCLGDAAEKPDIALDMYSYIDGDANCDGALTVADATAIMQAIGNPDKYGLSAQAKFNADIYNTGDGVTALDALKILRIEAGLE